MIYEKPENAIVKPGIGRCFFTPAVRPCFWDPCLNNQSPARQILRLTISEKIFERPDPQNQSTMHVS